MKAQIRHRLNYASHKIRSILNTGDHFSFYPEKLLRRHTDDKASQIALMQQYKAIAHNSPECLISFNDAGFRQYSQNEEDGLLLYIFSLIGTANKKCVEICVGDGTECNTLNLIINHGWWGLLFDGSVENIEAANTYYRSHRDTLIYPPQTKHAWITAENLNGLIADSGFDGEIDLVSNDIDGNDYWIWKALSIIQPRVVVIEYHNPIPPHLALTVPYNPNFRVESFADDFRGASLLAMVRLGKDKGYRLVGTNRHGFNAFFVKNGLGDNLLPEVIPESCSQDPYTKEAQVSRWPKVKDKPWLKV